MEFTYTAITKDGQRQTASIQAPNLASAGHLLKEQGLLPMDIKEQGATASFDLLKKFSSISLAVKISFIENLSVMLKAGISISRSLQILAKQTKNKKFQDILNDVYNQVQQGNGLSEALAKNPDIFPNIIISMIKVGEISGNLDKSLEYLSIQMQREADLKSKVKGAMIYPSVIMGAMFIIGVLMSIFVLPNLMSIFAAQSSSLPPATKLVMAFSNFMSHNAFLAIATIIAVVVGVIAALRTKKGQYYFDFGIIHAFIISSIVKKVNLARFSRILSSLLKSGIPIVQALEVAGESLDNSLYKELVIKAGDEVRLGKPLAETLGKESVLFPPLVVQMIEVGEESGAVQEILEQLAVHYEEDVDNTLRNLSSIIEPLLLLIIGGVVGFLALALISPIYSIYQNAT